jgi:plasmid stability protein
MNTLTIQLDDTIFSKLTAFARRHGKSAEDVVANVATAEIQEIEAMEKFEAMQYETASRLTPERVRAAFDEIRALTAAPLPGDELPQL